MPKTLLRHEYVPRGVAKDLFSFRGPEVVLSGPAGTGKSRACLEKLLLCALMNPGMHGLIVRKTATSLRASVLKAFREEVLTEALIAGDVTYYGGSGQEPEQYRFTNGSVITFGGMDQYTRIMSTQFDIIFVNEATELTEQDWDALTTRLRNGKMSFQQIIADCNPSYPTHWLKVRCDKGQTTMLRSTHKENPRFYSLEGAMTEQGEAYINGVLATMSGVMKARYHDGEWVSAEGAVYGDEWSSAVHLVKRFDIPKTWTRYWSVDFGVTNPTVVQMWAEDPDGRLYLYRELYHSGRLATDMGKQALGCVTDEEGIWTEPKPRYIVTDHDAQGRGEFTKAVGLGTVAADKKVLAGIEAVKHRLKLAIDGKPRLFILEDSIVERDETLVGLKKPASTAEEIPGYIWDVGAGKAPKEQVVKANDHGCDALRYVVMKLDQGPRTRVRYI